jgi:hypothetical protein
VLPVVLLISLHTLKTIGNTKTFHHVHDTFSILIIHAPI